MTRVSSTNLSHKEGVGAVWRALASNSSMNRVGYERVDGGTHGCTMYLFIVLTLEEEVGVFKAKLQECDNLGNGHLGLCGSVGSCVSLFAQW